MNLIEQEIFESVKKAINHKYLESANIEFVTNSNTVPYNSIIINLKSTVYRVGYEPKALLMRVKTNAEVTYVSFPDFQKKYIEGIFAYSTIKSDPFLRISIDEFLYKIKNSDDARKALNTIFLSIFSFDAFGCCGRYKECSQARKCIHPDLLYASACQYKKNLDEGKIFY